MASSFRVLNSSNEILLHPLALLTAVLPQAHLTSVSKCLALGGWPHNYLFYWPIDMPKYLYWSLLLVSDTELLTLVISKVIRALGSSFAYEMTLGGLWDGWSLPPKEQAMIRTWSLQPHSQPLNFSRGGEGMEMEFIIDHTYIRKLS